MAEQRANYVDLSPLTYLERAAEAFGIKVKVIYKKNVRE